MINLRIDNLTRPDRFIIFYMRIIDFLLIKNWKFLLWSLYSHSSLINRTFKFLIIPLQLSIFFISFVMFLFIYHPLSWEMLFFLLLKIAPKILCFFLSHIIPTKSLFNAFFLLWILKRILLKTQTPYIPTFSIQNPLNPHLSPLSPNFLSKA